MLLNYSLIVGVLLLADVTSGVAQHDPVRVVAQPRLEISEPQFNFGYAPQGASISHVFWLRNVGSDTLKLTDVRPGCGCTKAPLKTHVLAAGDSTDVEVIFNTGHYSSKVTKSASVICNAPNPQSLSISAFPLARPDSIAPFVLTPPMLSLDSLRPENKNTPWEYEIQVKNVSDDAITLALISAPDGHFSVQFPDEIPPHGEKSLVIKLAKDTTDQLLTKSFTVEASDPAKTRYTFPVTKAMRWGPAPLSAK